MTINKIHVVFPIFIDTYNYNAQSLNVREIVMRLDPERFQCTLFSVKNPDPRVVGLPHVRLCHIPRRLGSLTMIWESLKRQDIIFNLAYDLKFTDLYFRLPKSIRKRTQTIQWIETVLKEMLSFATPLVQKQFARIYPQVDCYVAITQHVAETSLRDYGIKANMVIPIGVDNILFKPAKRQPTDRVKVLYVGHLTPRKRPAQVLEAANKLRHVNFIIVGQDREDFKHSLLRIVEAYQLDNVTFLEPMPQSELNKLMATCDIMLHPSKVESMVKVILEGAATGLPAVMFNIFQSPVVVDNVTGYQVRTDSEMLSKLQLLVENEQLRLGMGAAAVEHARQFTWDKVAKQWEDVFMKVNSR